MKASKRIFISSAYRGNTKANILQARVYALDVLRQEYHPVVPHYAFNYLDDVPMGHPIALYLCCRELETCDEIWAFGKVTEGMDFEITYARGLSIKVVYID